MLHDEVDILIIVNIFCEDRFMLFIQGSIYRGYCCIDIVVTELFAIMAFQLAIRFWSIDLQHNDGQTM